MRPTASSKRRNGLLGWHLIEPNETFLGMAEAVAAEFIGTAIFVFLATGTITSGCHTKDVADASGNGGDTSLTKVVPGSCFLQSTTVLNIAMAFGFTLFAVIYFTASFSGGHINPAVTLGMFITRRISLLRGILYIIFQCSGAAVASVILKGLDPGGYKAAAGGANQVNTASGASPGTAVGFEIIGTFALVFVVFAATDSQRAISTAPLPVLAPFGIGMILFVIHLVLIPIDGCSVNPARSFGPAAVGRVWGYYWIFWVAPFVGAIVASVLYEVAFKGRPAKVQEDNSNDHWDGTKKPGDIEAGVPIASGQNAAVHTGVAGLAK